MSRWNPDRWVQTGVNSAGDPTYGRSVSVGGNVDLHSLSKAELQDLAEKAGVAKSGTKEEIIERLQA